MTMNWAHDAALLMQNIWPTGRGFPTPSYRRTVAEAEAIAKGEGATLVCTAHLYVAIQRELNRFSVVLGMKTIPDIC